MAVFAVLELEDAVQVSDKTRFSAEKSYVSKGSTALTTMTIKPGLDATPISIFSTNVQDWYLDWQFDSLSFDVDDTNNKIDYREDDAIYSVTIPEDTYATAEDLFTAIETEMDGAASFGTYSVAQDMYGKVVITTEGYNFQLLPVTGLNQSRSLLPLLGFVSDTNLGGSHVSDQVLDYSVKKVTLAIANATQNDSKDYYIRLYSAAGDRLFSSDSDLAIYEKDICKWVVKGRNTFKDVHRRAQREIVDWFSKNNLFDSNGYPYNKWTLLRTSDLRDWSTFISLRIIFQDLSNATDDIFHQKSLRYFSKEVEARNRYVRYGSFSGTSSLPDYLFDNRTASLRFHI